ncbi:MAG: bifunctional helix-turn-helix domain-containing protein/methylated-DNA--[protein]-cysteine S-methyltransferase [Bacteroidota bacterium]
MDTVQNIDFNRISKAIDYIYTHFRNQPSLDEIARHVHLSPGHFQKMFSDWAGVSPKKFLRYISLNYAKSLLKEKQATLFDTALDTGLSGTGRLHDLFIKIEGMTPAEYKHQGQGLTISYSYSESIFGLVIAASTHKGLCYLAFCTSPEAGFEDLKSSFSNATFQLKCDDYQKSAIEFLSKDNANTKIKLHIRGTEFQLKVWEAILKIPSGNLTTYGKIADELHKPKASRAVGTATGDNPIAFLIPCHRVIQASGALGGYMWGTSRKRALIGWEAAQLNP